MLHIFFLSLSMLVGGHAECGQSVRAAFGYDQMVRIEREGEVEEIQIQRPVKEDAAQIEAWFSKEEGTDAYHEGLEWGKWWVDRIRDHTETSEPKIWALKTNEGKILGLIALQEIESEYVSKKSFLYIAGIRIHPGSYHSKADGQRRYKGIGTSLLSFAVSESVRRDKGIVGLNSSYGAEKFYRAIGMNERQAFDGERVFFYLDGQRDQLAFLGRHSK